ncbi:MAG: prolipoprotein diacylglyceryl transferase [Polyangiaceae bacterium]|nr:prolipoprotein diacylglyceryl transferase [Polyangiaceae bacterium]
MPPALLEVALPAARVPADALGLGSAAMCAIAGVRTARGLPGEAVGRRALALVGVVISVGVGLALRGRVVELGPVRVHAWGAAAALGLVVGWWLTQRLARHAGLPASLGARACVAVALGALVGGRLAHAAATGGGALAPPGAGGLSLVGALVGGTAGAAVAAHLARVHPARLLDALAPGAALAIAVGRVGCWLHGCDFGARLPAEAPAWLARLGAFARWPEGDGPPAFVAQVELGLVSPTAAAALPVHPTQLYEVVVWAALVGVVAAVRTRATRDGAAWASLVVGYALARSALELLRADAGRAALGPALGPAMTLFACWGALGAALVVGALPDLRSARARGAAAAAALGVGPAAAALVGPGHAAPITADQWVVVLAGVGVALGWSWLPRRSAGEPAPDPGV